MKTGRYLCDINLMSCYPAFLVLTSNFRFVCASSEYKV